MCVLAHSSAAPRGLTSGRQAVFLGSWTMDDRVLVWRLFPATDRHLLSSTIT